MCCHRVWKTMLHRKCRHALRPPEIPKKSLEMLCFWERGDVYLNDSSRPRRVLHGPTTFVRSYHTQQMRQRNSSPNRSPVVSRKTILTKHPHGTDADHQSGKTASSQKRIPQTEAGNSLINWLRKKTRNNSKQLETTRNNSKQLEATPTGRIEAISCDVKDERPRLPRHSFSNFFRMPTQSGFSGRSLYPGAFPSFHWWDRNGSRSNDGSRIRKLQLHAAAALVPSLEDCSHLEWNHWEDNSHLANLGYKQRPLRSLKWLKSHLDH